MKLWTVTIVHRHGEGADIYTSEAAARAGLAAWADEWWDHEMQRMGRRNRKPKDAEELIDRYFEMTDESYSIGESEVRGLYALGDREHAAVLTGLRLLGFQMEQSDGAVPEAFLDILTSGGELKPLSAEEIDALCEGINHD